MVVHVKLFMVHTMHLPIRRNIIVACWCWRTSSLLTWHWQGDWTWVSVSTHLQHSINCFAYRLHFFVNSIIPISKDFASFFGRWLTHNHNIVRYQDKHTDVDVDTCSALYVCYLAGNCFITYINVDPQDDMRNVRAIGLCLRRVKEEAM